MGREPAESRFRRLYEMHYPSLFAYAARRFPDFDEAHDVVADAFLVLWRRLEEAPADEEVGLWLYGVMRRVVANRLRARDRRQRLAMRFASIVADIAETTEESVARRLYAETVFDALLQLGEQDREILLLAAWERLSTAELASIYSCSENAAAIRLHRARKRLSEAVAKETGESGDIPYDLRQ
jgi:RNA polymerase sigma factor (sigma-70 family)